MARTYGNVVAESSGKKYWSVRITAPDDDREYVFPSGKAAWRFGTGNRDRIPTARFRIYDHTGKLYISWPPKLQSS